MLNCYAKVEQAVLHPTKESHSLLATFRVRLGDETVWRGCGEEGGHILGVHAFLERDSLNAIFET